MDRFQGLFLKKSVDELRQDAELKHGFKRSLGALDLTMLGIGGVIGAGIFVITGHAAAANAGPAVALSFVLAGIASAFAGLCYAEMASMIPISGSAYAYTYATMGELIAWIIGWDLILEYLVGSATVCVGWSGYVVSFFSDSLGIQLPRQWTAPPLVWDAARHGFVSTGGYVNLPAVFISLFVTLVLILGIRESARFNAVIVFVKLTVILLFIALASPFIQTQHWTPFIPPNAGEFGHYGWSGVLQGATVVFFAYVGFDAVSTAAQECRNPQRDVPIGILASLAVCTVLYITVSLILTGVVPYTSLSVPNPIALGVQATGIHWLAVAVEIGAIAGLSSVILVLLLGQSRVFYSMAHDGLLPGVAARIHHRFGTPWFTTLLTGIACAVASGILPIQVLSELTSIGTLFAFVLVSLGVLILRLRRPDIPRRFRVPGGDYVVPLGGAISSGILIYTASEATILRFFGWLFIGLLIYGFYSRHHSKLRRGEILHKPS